MRPMALCESGEGDAKASLRALLDCEALRPARKETGLADVARWCCRGGWPAKIGLSDEAAA